MSTPIYTDKDYLDAQFETIKERFDRHDKRHEEDKADLLKFAGLVLTAAGIIASFVAGH